ncbi:hypothetical protein Tco_0714373 [Tanacetum coccineum]
MFEECRKRQLAANIDQLPPQEMSIQDMEDLKQQYLDEMKSLINEIQIKDYHHEKIDIQYRRECEIKIDELKQNFNGMSIEIRKKEKELLQQEQAAYVRTSQRFSFIDEDDDNEYSFATQEYLKKLSSTITPDLPKSDSLIMEDKHLDTISETKSIDSLFDEFAGELITIPPRIVNREHEEYISLLERLLYDNSSPRPPEDFHANPNTIIESLPTFPIPVEDSDSLREEIDIFPGPDDSIPPGIESDDYDSEGDDNSTSLPEFESFHVDYPDSGDSTIDVVEDIPVDVPNILPTHPTLHMDFDFIPSHNDLGSDLDVSSPSRDRNKIYDPGICIEVESTRFLATHSPVIDTLLPFSSENKDKVFNHGVLASKEKSPPS